jgi:processive 1,2-diacylglycerol beta-glucosyltransferase
MRVMILTLSFGSGHVRVAETIAREIRDARPDLECVVVDALHDCKLLFRAFYVWPYLAMIRFAPGLWKRFFESRRDRGAENTAPKWFWRFGCADTLKLAAKFRPDAIVACEVGAVELAEILVEDSIVNAPVIAVITDFDTEPIWAKSVVKAYAVPSEHVWEQLIEWGRGDAAIDICGIPVDRSFGERPSDENQRDLPGFDERPVILLMGGGVGPTRMGEVASELLRLSVDAQIVALPAKDKYSFAHLEAINSATAEPRVRVIQWTDNVAGLMRCATVLVTKPGGVTVSEAAASRLPMVLFDAIPGPENENARRLIEAGAAVEASGPEEAAAMARSLLADADKLESMREACEKIARPHAVQKVLKLVCEVGEPKAHLIQQKANVAA